MQQIQSGQKILGAFGQGVINVGLPDPANAGIGASWPTSIWRFIITHSSLCEYAHNRDPAPKPHIALISSRFAQNVTPPKKWIQVTNQRHGFSVGRSDQAMHQYDLDDFWRAVDHASMPAVSFLKARESQDGHAGYSGPLDEQRFLVETINRLQRSPQWMQTAIIIAYDDSDGWYDHVMPPIVRTSERDYDFLTGDKHCGDAAAGLAPGRCGYGPRLPLLVISPYARHNFVDHTLTDQTSIARFIEDNWGLPRLGDGAMDLWAGLLVAMFDLGTPARADLLILDPETSIQVMRGCLPSPALHPRRVGRHRRRADCDEP